MMDLRFINTIVNKAKDLEIHFIERNTKSNKNGLNNMHNYCIIAQNNKTCLCIGMSSAP